MSFQSPTLKQWWCFCIALVFFGCEGDWWDGSSTCPELLYSKRAGHTGGVQCSMFSLQTLALNWQPALALLLLWSDRVMPLMFGNCKIIWRQLFPFWRHGWSSGTEWGGQSLFPGRGSQAALWEQIHVWYLSPLRQDGNREDSSSEDKKRTDLNWFVSNTSLFYRKHCAD